MGRVQVISEIDMSTCMYVLPDKGRAHSPFLAILRLCLDPSVLQTYRQSKRKPLSHHSPTGKDQVTNMGMCSGVRESASR